MLTLVTGSTGFIGSQLCRALVSQGQHVRAFHRPNSPQLLLEGMDVEHVEGDITQPETIERAMHGVDVVFHTAALLGRRSGNMYAVTVAGTRDVLNAALKAGVRRFIYTSSVAALGVPENGAAQSTKLDESHAWNLGSESWPYGYAKYLAEVEVGKATLEGLDALIVNPSLVIGPGDLNKISGDVILRVSKGQVPIAISGGLNAVHIDDVVHGHLKALECGRTGERYILGCENLTHMRFLQIIAEVAAVQPPRVVLPTSLVRALATPISMANKWLSLPFDGEALSRVGYHFYYDTQKAARELGVNCTHSVPNAVAESYAWYLEQGFL
jgi:dihydroflavonol-4-reductase